MKYKTPIITLTGRSLDLCTTFIGLRLGFAEMNGVALTPFGLVAGFLPIVFFTIGEHLAKRIKTGERVVVAVSFVTWAAFLWNLHLIIPIVF
jgi:hypothetical protein